MTLRHVLAIAGALVFLFVVGAVITSACRRLWDWQAQRNHTPPPLFTEVWPRDIGRDFMPDFIPAPVDTHVSARVPVWLPPVEETLAEFARPVPTSPALIGSEVEALFELRRLAVNAA